MDNLSTILNDPRCDLGENAKVLAELVCKFTNARFIDLGVRFGHSSVIMSIESEKNNNFVCGCDISFGYFESFGIKYVSKDYVCYLADSVTLGKNWNQEPFDIIFIDTIHTREQVLAELYFWKNHIKKNGYFVFHDSHWQKKGGDIIGGEEHRRVDEAITDFFSLPQNVMTMTEYHDANIELTHYTPSHGMTFVKVKNPKALKEISKDVDWKDVFNYRNKLNSIFFNEESVIGLENELVITI